MSIPTNNMSDSDYFRVSETINQKYRGGMKKVLSGIKNKKDKVENPALIQRIKTWLKNFFLN